VAKTFANVQTVLSGNAASPTGNVELRASTEKNTFDATEFAKNTTLQGKIGGKDITLSSLTKSDWTTVGTTWFNAALTANGYGAVISNSTVYAALGNKTAYDAAWTKFVTGNGRERFSDPNISYVNQDDSNGKISIGLAGHLDATSLLFASLNASEKYAMNSLRDPSKAGKPIQASEIVKYTYDGKTDYLYSFYATPSGLKAIDDDKSHTGNYEVSFQGVKPPVIAKTAKKPVPVPAGFVGIALAGVIGGGMMKRRKLASKA
jgi:hypothetical protein